MSTDWTAYFPFADGEHLLIEVRVFFGRIAHGYGHVLRNAGNDLAFDLTIPEQSALGHHIDETSLTCEIAYRREGGGNYARIAVDGRVIEDKDLNIVSRPNTHPPRRRIDPTDAPDAPDIAFTLSRSGPRKAELTDIRGLPNLRWATIVIESGDKRSTERLIAEAAEGLL